MKPNLFIVGAPKCGTTAWYEYLRGHPDIFFPEVKEPNHFSTEQGAGERIADRAKYLELYRGAGSAKVVGDATPAYLRSETAANSIHEFNPDAKILIFIRDQESFLLSAHNHQVFRGTENIRDFETAWRLSGRRDASNSSPLVGQFSKLDYREAAAFDVQVERYFALFPPNQIRVFHHRDWTRNPRAIYLEILGFLGLNDDGRTEFAAVNEARHHRAGFIVKLVTSPPRPINAAVTLLRRLSGRTGLGVANFLFKLGMRKGSASRMSPELREEITRFYEEGNRRLEARIWKPDGSLAKGGADASRRKKSVNAA